MNLNIIKNYLITGEKQAIVHGAYYYRLAKATAVLSIVPIMVVTIMVIYEKMTFLEGVSSAIAVLFGTVFFARPYIQDLAELRDYVDQLLLDQKVEIPELSLLGGVEELSTSVQNLHRSWQEKKIKLEAAIAETSIVLDTIPDILMMLGRDLRIIRANKAAELLFGRNIVGKNFVDICHEELLSSMVTEVVVTKIGVDAEIAVTSHNVKREYQVNVENFPLFSIGGIAVVLIMHDVTEAKRTRQMIKDFVANASHEIRTPLTSISGFIENLRDMDEDRDTRKKFLDIMHSQAERMGILVNDLLSLSKVEMNEAKRPTDSIMLAELLQSTIFRMEHLAAAKNMKIDYVKQDDLPAILGDADELSQVFTNLISNAIKYGYNDTVITVKLFLTDITENLDQKLFKHCTKLLAVSVEDKGEGIPKEHLARITERFYRVDKMRSRNIGGTGLGLAIVKHIMNRHLGELTIESVENEGSVFTVFFQVEEE